MESAQIQPISQNDAARQNVQNCDHLLEIKQGITTQKKIFPNSDSHFHCRENEPDTSHAHEEANENSPSENVLENSNIDYLHEPQGDMSPGKEDKPGTGHVCHFLILSKYGVYRINIV